MTTRIINTILFLILLFFIGNEFYIYLKYVPYTDAIIIKAEPITDKENDNIACYRWIPGYSAVPFEYRRSQSFVTYEKTRNILIEIPQNYIHSNITLIITMADREFKLDIESIKKYTILVSEVNKIFSHPRQGYRYILCPPSITINKTFLKRLKGIINLRSEMWLIFKPIRDVGLKFLPIFFLLIFFYFFPNMTVISNNKTSKLFLFSFIIVLLSAIGFRLFKATHSGMLFDELFSIFQYSENLKTVFTLYDAPNNHILNSFILHFTARIFNFSEYYPRIHAVVFSIIYSVGMFVIIRKIFTHNIIALSALLVLLFNIYIFDLSILARGYTIALAVIAVEIYLALRFIDNMDQQLSCQLVIKTAIVFSVLNFLAFAASFTSLVCLVAICFGLVVYLLINGIKSKNYTAFFLFTGITVLLTGIFFAAILLPIFSQFAETVQKSNISGNAWNEFTLYIGNLFSLFTGDFFITNRHNSIIFFALVVFLLFRFYLIRPGSASFSDKYSIFFLFFFLVYVFLLYINLAVFRTYLGYPRNHVFLIPVFILAAFVLLESMILWNSSKAFNAIISTISIILMTGFIFRFPSTHVIEISNWKYQSITKPLITDLMKLDKKRHWTIFYDSSFSYATYWFYTNYYNISTVTKDKLLHGYNSSVKITDIEKTTETNAAFKYDFYRQFGALVIINTNK